jgi:hypothetical protein
MMAAFTLVVTAGLTFVAVVTPGYVFGAAPTKRRRLRSPAGTTTYLVGLGMIALLESAVDAPRIVVVVGTVAPTAPLNFLGGSCSSAGVSGGIGKHAVR